GAACVVGVGRVALAPGDGGNAPGRVAQQLLPQPLAVEAEDFQLTALGVEGDAAVRDHRGGRPVVAGLVLPELLAGLGVEGVKLVAAEAAAEEDPAVHDRGRGQRPAPRDDDLPALLTLLAGKGNGPLDLAGRGRAVEVRGGGVAFGRRWGLRLLGAERPRGAVEQQGDGEQGGRAYREHEALHGYSPSRAGIGVRVPWIILS